MRIEFDPTNPEEAAAVRAMLTALGPTEVSIRDDVDMDAFVRTMKAGITESMGAGVANRAIPNCDDPNEAITIPDADTDSTGTPWDARIHSTPPTTNKDGTWRAKRGVKAEEIAAVRAEREAQTYETDVTPEGVAQVREKAAEALADADLEQIDPPAPAQEQSAPPAPNAPVGEQTAPPAPPAPIVQPEPVVGVAPSFLDVMKAITAAQKDGKIDTAKVKELCAAVGAGESTMGLNGPDNGDKRGAFMALLASETEGK